MDFEELTKYFTPLTLTESISRIKTEEPLVLKSRLGRNTQNMLDELCGYEVGATCSTVKSCGVEIAA